MREGFGNLAAEIGPMEAEKGDLLEKIKLAPKEILDPFRIMVELPMAVFKSIVLV